MVLDLLLSLTALDAWLCISLIVTLLSVWRYVFGTEEEKEGGTKKTDLVEELVTMVSRTFGFDQGLLKTESKTNVVGSAYSRPVFSELGGRLRPPPLVVDDLCLNTNESSPAAAVASTLAAAGGSSLPSPFSAAASAAAAPPPAVATTTSAAAAAASAPSPSILTQPSSPQLTERDYYEDVDPVALNSFEQLLKTQGLLVERFKLSGRTTGKVGQQQQRALKMLIDRAEDRKDKSEGDIIYLQWTSRSWAFKGAFGRPRRLQLPGLLIEEIWKDGNTVRKARPPLKQERSFNGFSTPNANARRTAAVARYLSSPLTKREHFLHASSSAAATPPNSFPRLSTTTNTTNTTNTTTTNTTTTTSIIAGGSASKALFLRMSFLDFSGRRVAYEIYATEMELRWMAKMLRALADQANAILDEFPLDDDNYSDGDGMSMSTADSFSSTLGSVIESPSDRGGNVSGAEGYFHVPTR